MMYDAENCIFLNKPTFKPNHSIIHQSFCIHDDGFIYVIGGYDTTNHQCSFDEFDNFY